MLWIVLLFIFLMAFVQRKQEPIHGKTFTTQDGRKVQISDIKKVCPPHKWQWVEIKDHEGVTHAWKLECELCGPIKDSV